MYVKTQCLYNLKISAIQTIQRNLWGEWAYADIESIDDDTLEIYFDSRWDFPIDEMNKMVEDLPNKDDIYIRVLSVEYGEYYCAFHVYDGESWECM